MSARRPYSRRDVEADPMPLDVVRATFGWLQVGPQPLAIDGREFAGMPDREVPLGELRDRLLARSCPQRVRDAVWAHLVARSREDGGAWTVGCAGVALPALTRTAATLTARFAGDPRDVHAAVLAGFLAELAVVDLARPRIVLRLRWAAYRAGHAAVRDALDAPVPVGHGMTPASAAPPVPGGHPDFVLARAVADGVISRGEAELIGSTRLEEVSLAAAARARRAGYEATKKARRRAELRLAAWLLAEAQDSDPGPTPQRVPPPTRATAAHRRTAAQPQGSLTVTDSEMALPRRRGVVRRVVRRRMTTPMSAEVSPPAVVNGVQGRRTTPIPGPSPTAEVQRCA